MRSQNFIALILVIAFLSLPSSSHAAEVYYLGGNSSGSSGDHVNPSYSLKQRIQDLLNFSKENTDRSGRISGSFSQEVDWNDVAGNTSKSFLRRGTDYVTETNLNLQEKLPGNYNLESQMSLRKTDNPRIDPRRDVRMKQFSLKAMNPNNFYEFGDMYADFSQFTLGASLEGAHAILSPSTASKYQLVAARVGEADVAADKFQRNVAGVKADHNFFTDSKLFSNFRVGAQAVSVQDDASSLDRTADTQDLKNAVFSTDGEIAFRGPVALQYEVAHSENRLTTDAGANTSDKANAVRVLPSVTFDKLGIRYLYYMAQPKFYTDQGSASPDKMQHQWTMDYRFSKKVSVNLVENYYWDHLPGSSRTKRTTNDEKYLTWNLRPFDNRPQLTFRPYVNYAVKNSDDAANSAEGITRTAGFSFSDSIERVIQYGARYEFRSYLDEANDHAGSDYSHRIGVNVSREQQVFARRLYLALEPTMDLRRTKTDPNYDTSFSVGLNTQYDISQRWLFRATNTLTDANNAQPASDYMQNRSSAEFDFILGPSKAVHFVTRYERNRYVHEDGDQSYTESRVIGKLSFNF